MKNKLPLIVLFLTVGGILFYYYITSKTHKLTCVDCKPQQPLPCWPGMEERSEPIYWNRNNYEQALAAAKTTNKKLFVEFDASWCSWCKKMKKESLSDKDVLKKLGDNYILCSIDFDKNKDLANKLGVRGLPTFVIVHNDGKIFRKYEGYLNKENFIAWLNQRLIIND